MRLNKSVLTTLTIERHDILEGHHSMILETLQL